MDKIEFYPVKQTELNDLKKKISESEKTKRK